MDERKKLILDIIIKEHIETGQPVASSVVVDKYQLPYSSATVRNEMAELEEAGWIMQPYTSAGRIPTEKAYELFTSSLTDTPLPKKEGALLEANSGDEAEGKRIAKQLAQLSGLAVVWAFHKNHVYYTGVSNLLQQPEFTHPHLIYDISAIIDRVDEIVGDIFETIDFAPRVVLGTRSPFGPFSGAVLSRFRTPRHIGLIGVIGPLRMDYEKNRSRIQFLTEQLSNLH